MKTFFASLIGNHSVAEYVLLHLTDEYLRACPDYSNRKYLPGQYDLIANACLFLCSEYKGQLSNAVLKNLFACKEALDKNHIEDDLYKIVWDLARGLMRDKYHRPAADLAKDLDHHDSDIRYYVLEIASFVTRYLPQEIAVDKLLRNVAFRHLWWEESLGLCRRLFTTDEELLEYAKQYSVPYGANREFYQETFRYFEESAVKALLESAQLSLDKFEVQARRTIDEVSLKLPTGIKRKKSRLKRRMYQQTLFWNEDGGKT